VKARWHYRRSLASRVTLLTTIAVAAAVAFVALGAFVTVRMQMQSTLDHSLLDRAYKAVQSPTLSRATANDVPSWMLGAADIRIGFITDDGEVLTADDWPEIGLGEPELGVASGDSDHIVRTIQADGGERYRVATVSAGDGQALVVAQSLAPQDETLAALAVVMSVFGLVGVLVAALAGWAVARNGLRPVRRLTASVERIARTEDLTPLPVEGQDEIARLASAFNQVLTALAASRDRQRQLVGDAGHELRTPLTSLRTNLDLLTQADGAGGLPPEARAELLSDVRAQIEELTTLVGDLVELARDEPMTLVLESADLTEIVDQALTRVRRRAPGITFKADLSPWWIEGDSGALERAVANLLDNAAKWSPPDGIITVALNGGVLTVDDEGPGIAEEDLPHVFERFYRSDESRSMPGSGLGLSIVARVVERHAGTVAAGRSPSGGARLTITLPGRSVLQAPPLDEGAATDRMRGAGDRPSIATRRTPQSRSTAP
jgi:two-component system sensor histidine kinase MprB